MNDERLVVVGTGIRTVGHMTMESIAWIKKADRVLTSQAIRSPRK
jgi:precorrin-2 methylase